MSEELSLDEIQFLKEQYPDVVLLQDGSICLRSRDKKEGLIVTPEILAQLQISQANMNCIKSYGKGCKHDLFELVKQAGLEHEYCLIFMGQIFFHSASKEECDAYQRTTNLCFTMWEPITKV